MLFSTWDQRHPGKWFGAEEKPQEQSDPLAEYTAVVDRWLYVASAAFLACLVILIIR